VGPALASNALQQVASNVTIERQHETTSIPELNGAACSALRAVRNSASGSLELCYIELGTVWHRFYLDAGVLFWDEGRSPDEEEDLLEGDEYFDVAHALGVQDVALREVCMRDCLLRLEFENGARLVLKHAVGDEHTTIAEWQA
jgi:hypothetical protein